MKDNVYKLRDKGGESEKITINLGYVDLGRIDLLVQEGFYSNRTDFIRTAIRNQLAAEAEAVKQSIVRHTLELGLRDYSRADLELLKAGGERLHIKVVGLARIAPDVTPELALTTIESITVLGAHHAPCGTVHARLERRRGDTRDPGCAGRSISLRYSHLDTGHHTTAAKSAFHPISGRSGCGGHRAMGKA